MGLLPCSRAVAVIDVRVIRAGPPARERILSLAVRATTGPRTLRSAALFVCGTAGSATTTTSSWLERRMRVWRVASGRSAALVVLLLERCRLLTQQGVLLPHRQSCRLTFRPILVRCSLDRAGCGPRGETAMVRIVVVDDDLDFQELIRDVLREQGWDAVPCTTTPAAYVTFRSVLPDVILLDVRMERLHAGWDVLTYLQLHPVLREIPVVLCSAMADEIAAKDAWLVAHGVDTLLKPFELDHLYELIHRHLAARVPATLAV